MKGRGGGGRGGSIKIPDKIHKPGHCTKKVSHKLNRAESLYVSVNRVFISQLPVAKSFESKTVAYTFLACVTLLDKISICQSNISLSENSSLCVTAWT